MKKIVFKTLNMGTTHSIVEMEMQAEPELVQIRQNTGVFAEKYADVPLIFFKGKPAIVLSHEAKEIILLHAEGRETFPLEKEWWKKQ